MPDIKIRSITLEKTSIEPGNSIIYEVCIENVGDSGDIDLYAGFGYQDGNITFIGNGYGHGYWIDTIGAVGPGEYLCPIGTVEMPDEALTLQNQGKDIRFFATAISGNSMSKDVTVISPPPCTQQFRLEDQNGNPISGTLTVDGQTFNVTGDKSLSLETGKEYAATAVVGGVTKQAAFAACTNKIIFVFTVEVQCTQQFRLEDQNGNPLSGHLTGPDIEVITVPASGEISTSLTQGKQYTITAFVGTFESTKTFTACTGKIIFQFTIIEQCTQQFRLEDLNSNPLSGTLSITEKDFDVTGDISLFLETGKEYAATAVVGGVTKQAVFTACTSKIIFKFTVVETPTLTTTITSPEPYVAGTNIEIKTVLKSSTGVPIQGKKVFFYTLTDFITANFTNENGEVTISFNTGIAPATYEIYVTHLTDDSIFVESNHVIFTTTEGTYSPTSLSLSIDPINIGPGQYSDITGTLAIQGKDPDQILPGIPLKLYCDKGIGDAAYQLIATLTTPPSGTGIVTFQYGAQQDDASKTLKFKFVYDGSESLKLNPSESGIAELIVAEEPILIETITTLAVSPTEIKPGNILILKSKITETETGNTLPVGTFVHFYIGTRDLGITGTISDGYAYTQFKIPANYIGPYICKAKYEGIVNQYGSSESTFNINVNPECVEHETEPACIDEDCFWWSDDTCKGYAEPPPEATGSIGFIIKPNSWYRGNTEQAVVDLTAKTSEILSILTKYSTSFIDIELLSIDIYQDKNIDRVILKIYYKDTGIQTMVALVTLAAWAIGAIAAIFVVTAVVGWIESWFADDDIDHPTEVPEDEIIDAGQGGIDDAGDDAAGNVYGIDDEDATALNDCLDTAETEEDILECYGLVGIPEEDNTDDNAETLGIAKWTAALAVLYTLCESLDDQVYCHKADELDATLNTALTEFRAGTISKENFLLIVTQELNDLNDFLEVKEEEAKEEREDYATDKCFIVNPGYPITSDKPCIITNTQALIGGTVIGLGALGLFLIKRR